jgi:hypothetical protein
MSNQTDQWTVEQVLGHVRELGIPHFQRGLVWGVDSRAALLESLFYDTPCGSFVLWVPKDCAARGVPLDPSICTGMKYLVIDGQQRIRSLHSVFNRRAEIDEDNDESEGQDDSPGDGHKTWCINLTRVREFAERLKTPGREFAMFVHTLDPVERMAAKQPSPLMYNMLPLHVVLEADAWGNPLLAPYRDLLQPEKKAGELTMDALEALYKKLHTTVLDMKKRVFFVSVQDKDDPAAMADLYNRINAGGKRVEVEERAFARLVGIKPRTYDELARLFETVHGQPSPAGSDQKSGELPGRDEVLKRQKERAFGFKLFIRVFLQVCQHHLGFRQAKSEFSFDLANKGYFLSAFRQLGDEQVAYLWGETTRVLAHTRRVLKEELACDDLRSLPETKALEPIFQLLIHYPALSEEQYRPLLASLCLRLMLAEPDSKSLLKLLHAAANPGHVAFAVIPEMLQVLDKANERPKLSYRLEQAKSIQHRYVLLLYWLARQLGARDFLYANVPQPNQLNGPERPLEEWAEPEKQHLLPFKKAQALYPGDLRRGGAHIVNSVGNLTYISREQNSFERGLGDRFADLAAEPEENLRAHLLVGQSTNTRVLRDYDQLREQLTAANASGTSKVREIFEHMARRRREIIQDGFRQWLDALDTRAAALLKLANLGELGTLARVHGRLEPAPPAFASPKDLGVEHLIRKLELGHDDEDRVVYLAQNAARVPSPKDDKLKRDLWLTKKRKLVWVKARPARVALCFDRAVSKTHRRQIVETLGLSESGAEVSGDLDLKPVPDFHGLVELMTTLRTEIELAAESVTPIVDGKRPTGRTWDEARYFASLTVSECSPEVRDLANKLRDLATRFPDSVTLEWGTGKKGTMVVKRQGGGLIEVRASGKLRFRPNKFARALGESGGAAYRQGLEKLVPNAMKMGYPLVTADEAAKVAPDVLDLVEKVLEVAEAVASDWGGINA